MYIKCINLYIEKLIFNTCTVCSRKHIDFDGAERGSELLLWFPNQTQHFFQSSKFFLHQCHPVHYRNRPCASWLSWEFMLELHPLFFLYFSSSKRLHVWYFACLSFRGEDVTDYKSDSLLWFDFDSNLEQISPRISNSFISFKFWCSVVRHCLENIREISLLISRQSEPLRASTSLTYHQRCSTVPVNVRWTNTASLVMALSGFCW